MVTTWLIIQVHPSSDSREWKHRSVLSLVLEWREVLAVSLSSTQIGSNGHKAGCQSSMLSRRQVNTNILEMKRLFQL